MFIFSKQAVRVLSCYPARSLFWSSLVRVTLKISSTWAIKHIYCSNFLIWHYLCSATKPKIWVWKAETSSQATELHFYSTDSYQHHQPQELEASNQITPDQEAGSKPQHCSSDSWFVPQHVFYCCSHISFPNIYKGYNTRCAVTAVFWAHKCKVEVLDSPYIPTILVSLWTNHPTSNANLQATKIGVL